MANKNNKPIKNSFSVAGEKINAFIERDIALTVFVMATGLLYKSDSGLRGFPVGWLSTANDSGIQSRPEFFFISLITAVIIVVIGELINGIIRKSAEPSNTSSSVSMYTSQPTVYANSYDDDVINSSTDSSSAKEIKLPEFRLTKNLNKNRNTNRNTNVDKNPGKNLSLDLNSKENPILRELNEKAALAGKKVSSSYSRAGRGASNAFAGFFIAIIAMIGITFAATTFLMLDVGDDYSTSQPEDTDDFYSSAFFLNERYMMDKCDEAMDMLVIGDAGGLDELGEGSPEALINMADWSSLSYSEENRTMTQYDDPDNGFIRFIAKTDDGEEYTVAFKFEGDGMADNENAATLVGIAACPREIWDEYDIENEYYDLIEAVESNMQYVGDVTYQDENILTW